MTAGTVATGMACGLGLTLVLAGCGASSEEGRTPPFFGLNVPRASTAESGRLARLLQCEPSVESTFVKLDSDFGPADLAELGRDGRTPMVTLEPWSWRMGHGQAESPAYALRQLVAGQYDAQLTALARTLATHEGPVLLRFAHEMNANWYPWGAGVNGNVPDHYVWAWRHVHAIISRIAPDLTWVWAPVVTWWPDAVPLRSLYPGDDVVDVVGVTGYGREGGTAEETFGPWYREVRDLTDKPALLAEIGADGPGKREWIDSLPAFLDEHPDIEGFVWFNTSPETTGATGDYRIDEDDEDLATFRALLSQLDVSCTPHTTDSRRNS